MAPAEVSVELVHSPAARQVQQVRLRVPAGATVREVLLACGWFDMASFDAAVGIWGRKVTQAEAVREGDRIEIYRGLSVDPKEARRQRYRAHGEKLPKGYHRPRDWVKDMTQSPTKAPLKAPIKEPTDKS